ncbi:hypothetical protein HMN09_01236300 [Mycena chlorophos]|uniref:Cytochrome P450 n=1 Tax=Mycena chlorophos TaxID=658473 RepID=A0A8H6VRX1_MYCCL|nr:hypothetical protein HMN09_01236300 [Mycena chlorophos]
MFSSPVTDIAVLLGTVWLLTKLFTRLIASRSATKGTRLRGPPRASLLFGVGHILLQAEEPATIFEDWATTYGGAFEIPAPFGQKCLILTDPRAVNHFYASERAVYVKPTMMRRLIGNIFGRGLLWAEGNDHKRQRKTLTPAFTNAAIRQLTQVFYNSAHKLEGYWDASLEKSPEGIVLDVEAWMNRIALDSMGIAAFGHDFRALDGEPSAVTDAFESMVMNGGRTSIDTLNLIVFVLGTQIPLLADAPTPRNLLFKKLRKILGGIADSLMEDSKKARDAEGSGVRAADRSTIGLLLKAERNETEFRMNKDEITAQMNGLLLAGYETTSISLTWALIELCRNPELQDQLRAELRAFGPEDPTWDQLTGTALPFLDGVVLETLRLHPALPETTRQAQVDDIVPLSEPVVTATGESVDRITVPKDTVVTVSIRYMNRATALWGEDAAEFKPERWSNLESSSHRAKEIQGHQHLLTFLDGPRTCLGQSFALAEFKAVLSVLVRNYSFEFPGEEGKDTRIKMVLGLIMRPAVEGQDGPIVPLRVKRVET